MNATMARFGHPGTLVSEYRHWAVLVRPQQVSLGSLVLVSTSDARAFSELDAAAFTELRTAVGDIESTLHGLFEYEKINYLMLMMVDPHVHFHVIPRYAEERQWDGCVFVDPGWPGPPELSRVNDTEAATHERLVQTLRERWPRSRG